MCFIPGIDLKMTNSGFWIEKIKDDNRLIMDYKDIRKFNQSIIDGVSSVCDIEKYPDRILGDKLKEYIKEYKIPDKIMYDINGREIKEDFYNEIIENINIECIKDEVDVRFGISVNNTRLRKFPRDVGVFKARGDIEFDRFQETCCTALEAVVVLHESFDGEWYFIQMYNYRGWVKSKDIAIAKVKEDIFKYINNENFLVVTGDFVRCGFNHYDNRVSRNEFYMGTRIPLDNDKKNIAIGNQGTDGNYVVKIAVRDDNGNLEFSNGLLSKNSDVSIGYVPYKRKNILEHAFKLLGDRYDWGSKNGGRDCSGFIMCVYAVFGFRLPRNANDQEIAPGRTLKFKAEMDINERNNILDSAMPGAAIFMDGHVMMYIGKHNMEHYMIHDFNGFSKLEKEEYVDVKANEIAVTPVNILTLSHRPFIGSFTTIVHFE